MCIHRLIASYLNKNTQNGSLISALGGVMIKIWKKCPPQYFHVSSLFNSLNLSFFKRLSVVKLFITLKISIFAHIERSKNSYYAQSLKK